MKYAMSIAVAVGTLSGGASAQHPGLATWMTWTDASMTPPWRVESTVPGVTARVIRAANGAELNSAAALAEAGWRVGDGLMDTPPRAGGSRLEVRVGGLPAGTHTVYLRYHDGPRAPGNEWWYITHVGLSGARDASPELRLVSGMGGIDRSSLYERNLGTVGSEEEPVEEVGLTVERYQWSQFSRIGAIRIETEPSIHASHTAVRSPSNDAVRARLLEGAVAHADGAVAYAWRVAPSGRRIRPKRLDDLVDLPLADSIRLSAAGGEYESRQVLLYAPERSIEQVSFTATNLKGPGGEEIDAANILACPVGYVPQRAPANPALHGFWPEPILDFLSACDVRRHDVQSFWYRVFVPRGTPPGLYQGTAQLTPAHAPAVRIPVEVRVRAFDLPPMPHLRVVAGISGVDCDFEMDYGINPSSIYMHFVTDDPETLARWKARGATAICLGYMTHNWHGRLGLAGGNSLPDPGLLEEWLDEIGRRYAAVTAAGLREEAYLYLFDEAGPEWHPAMRVITGALKERFPDLVLMTTAHDPQANFDPDTDGEGKPIGAWTGGLSGLERIDAWVPLTFHFDYRRAREARKHGRQVWWYTCNSPQPPHANFLPENTALDGRMLMGFLAFAYQTDGFLYYATRGGVWGSRPPITSGPYQDGWSMHYDHFYPKGPGNRPLPSIRMEMLRDGLEDYDYLYIAREWARDPRVAASRDPVLTAGRELVHRLSAPGNDLVQTLTRYTRDVAAVEEMRERIAEFIERASSTGRMEE